MRKYQEEEKEEEEDSEFTKSIVLIAMRYIDVGIDIEEVVMLHGDVHMLPWLFLSTW